MLAQMLNITNNLKLTSRGLRDCTHSVCGTTVSTKYPRYRPTPEDVRDRKGDLITPHMIELRVVCRMSRLSKQLKIEYTNTARDKKLKIRNSRMV